MAGTEGGAAGASGSLLPNQTLYVNNINDKIHKTTLRRCLYALFSQFGPVLDVVALKTPKMRGQAHIVFKVGCSVWLGKMGGRGNCNCMVVFFLSLSLCCM